MTDYLTVIDAARLTHIGRNTISRAIQFNELKAIRRGPIRGWLIELTELDRWLKERSNILQGAGNGKA
jgi:excisionase family DNA binding protein|tara:strand:+ start:4169 stop:4372 length:204 start_codon:yes stop_codon:yes gene_type:complete